MTFTYNASLASELFQVRFLLQDTVDSTARPALLDDGEITWALSTESNIYMAAAMCADALASRFRGTSRKKVGDLELHYSAKMWDDIAAKLRARGAVDMIPTAGGILIADRDAIWADTSLLRPSFYSGLGQDPTQPSDGTPYVSPERES